jgi:pimeloyl-ACP methyl ester carboxylesterase
MQFIVQGYPAYAYTGGRPFDPSQRALLFIHGAAFDHSVWQWQSRYFAHHGFSVLAVDLPAHGRSPGIPRTSIEAMADWVNALIEAAGIQNAALVGHSMGGLVALETARRFPRRVSRLARVGAAIAMAVGPAFLAAAKDDAPEGVDMEAVWGHARSAVLATSPVPGTYLLGASRRLNGRARNGVLHADLNACNTYRFPLDEWGRTPPAGVRPRVLVVAGKRDQMTPFKAGKAAAEALGAKLAVLDAGHSMMSEAPRELLAALRDFLGG